MFCLCDWKIKIKWNKLYENSMRVDKYGRGCHAGRSPHNLVCGSAIGL